MDWNLNKSFTTKDRRKYLCLISLSHIWMCKLRFWGQKIFWDVFLKYPAFRYYVKVPHKKMKLYNVTGSIILQILRGVHILHQRSFVTFLTMILVFTISIRPKVHGNRQLFEDQSTLKKTPFWKVFLKSVNPFYLAVPHHSQSYCLFVLCTYKC